MITDKNSFLIGVLTGLRIKAWDAGRRIIMGLIAKLIRANGIYRASDDGADGYSMVDVNVPNSYTAADEGKVVVNGALEAQTARAEEIVQNGIYNTTTNNFITVNVGGSSPIEAWNFTSGTPLVGSIHKCPLTNYSVSFDTNGAVFNGVSDYLLLGSIPKGRFVIEIDVASMSLPIRSNHQRFIMGDEDSGLIYRYTSHQWEFYGGSSWATSSGEGDGAFFDGATVTVEVDEDGYWHIYKNGVLWYEPDVPQRLTSFRIGSGSNSILNTTIEGMRWY